MAETIAATASIEVVDLRTIWPVDADTVLDSVARTSRALVLQEASRVDRRRRRPRLADRPRGLRALDAPVAVVAAPDSPIPYAPELEDAYLPSAAG